MILFALPLTLLMGAVVFATFWLFRQKTGLQPNRFGGRRSARNIGGAITQGFDRCFDFKGRSSRLDFWTFAVFAGGVWLATLIIFIILVLQNQGGWAGLLLIVMWPVAAVPSLAVAVRRLHDVNRSGWWLLLLFVFGYFVLLYWFLRPSQSDAADLF